MRARPFLPTGSPPARGKGRAVADAPAVRKPFQIAAGESEAWFRLESERFHLQKGGVIHNSDHRDIPGVIDAALFGVGESMGSLLAAANFFASA